MFKKIRNNRGATAIEYGIIAAGIAVAIMAGLTVTGTNTKQTFCTIASAIGAESGNCSGSSSGGTSSGSSATYSTSNAYSFNSQEAIDFANGFVPSSSYNATGIYDKNGNTFSNLQDMKNYVSQGNSVYMPDPNQVVVEGLSYIDTFKTDENIMVEKASYKTGGTLSNSYQTFYFQGKS